MVLGEYDSSSVSRRSHEGRVVSLFHATYFAFLLILQSNEVFRMATIDASQHL